MSKTIFDFVRRNRLFSRMLLVFTAAFLVVSWLLPLIVRQADAVQLISRSLTMSSGVPSASGATNTYTFGFTIGATSTGTLQSLKFVACTTAIGTYGLGSTSSTTGCTSPAGITINSTTAVFVSQTGFQGATSFASDGTGAGNCTPGANVLCAKRTDATNQTASTAKTIKFSTITNPSTTNSTFFIGIYTYSDAGYATNVDSGTVAGAVVQTLTVNAAVAEILNFCVGSTSVDTGSGALPANCAAVSGTSVNLGTLDSTHVNITPVSTNCSVSDCSKNGLAMIQSNAINGTSVYYDAIQQSGTNHQGTLRISTATCTADTANASTDQTDQCFNERPAAATFTAGTERYGMTVAAVNCSSVAAYSCTFAGGTYNMTRTANYNSTGSNTYTTDTNQITGTSNSNYAWDESGTATQLASSSSSTIKQVDNEGLILKFAATPAITTPFGVYTAKADFIAVSTY